MSLSVTKARADPETFGGELRSFEPNPTGRLVNGGRHRCRRERSWVRFPSPSNRIQSPTPRHRCNVSVLPMRYAVEMGRHSIS